MVKHGNDGSIAMTFWLRPLAELDEQQWEALCDGCGRCCMHKFQDEDSGEMLYTDVACRLFDVRTCRCTNYIHRSQEVPGCMCIRSFTEEQFAWLPTSCAYRLRFEGQPLPAWHPLRSGDSESVHAAGISMRHACVSELDVPEEEVVLHILPDSGADSI